MQSSESGPSMDHFSRLEKAIQSFEMLKEGQDMVFSDDGEFKPYEIGFVGSFFWSPPSLEEEVNKAKEFIHREIQEITKEDVTRETTDKFKTIQKQTDQIKKTMGLSKSYFLNDLGSHLDQEIKDFRKELIEKQRIEPKTGDRRIRFEDLKEVEIPEEILTRQDEFIQIEPSRQKRKGKEPVIEPEPEEEPELDLGSWEIIEKESQTDEVVADRFETPAEVSKKTEEGPSRPTIRHLTESDTAKIEKYVKKNKGELFKHALPKRLISRQKEQQYWRQAETGLRVPIQIHLPKGKKTKPDEMLVIVHLKPDRSRYSIKQGRERNVFFLGQGAFKQVRLSAGYEVSRGTWQNYASATLQLGKGEEVKIEQIREALEEMDREIGFLERLSGKPGVIQLVGHCIYPIKGSEKDAGWVTKLLSGDKKRNMVMSYAESDLQREFDFENAFKAGEKKGRITLGVLEGLVSIHSERIVHLDIKPANILLAGGAPLIADFGLAHDIKKGPSLAVGTPAYMAPEVWGIVDKRIGLNKVDGKADVFSAGVMLYKMYHNGRFPGYKGVLIDYQNGDPNTTPHDIVNKMRTWHAAEIRRLEMKKRVKRSDTTLREEEIILQMLNPDPAKRLSSEEAYAAFQELYEL